MFYLLLFARDNTPFTTNSSAMSHQPILQPSALLTFPLRDLRVLRGYPQFLNTQITPCPLNLLPPTTSKAPHLLNPRFSSFYHSVSTCSHVWTWPLYFVFLCAFASLVLGAFCPGKREYFFLIFFCIFCVFLWLDFCSFITLAHF